MRDRISNALYFLLHHANLSTASGYPDELATDQFEQDALRKGRVKPQYLPRSKLDKQLDKLSVKGHWNTAHAVIEKLELLDNETLREATLNYRNAASHSIAPRFEMGVIPYVKRQYKLAGSRIPQADGATPKREGQTGFVLSYGFGEHDPLQHAPTFRLIRAQLKLARDTLCAYEALLLEVFERINAKRTGAARDDLHNSQRSVIARSRAVRCVAFFANSSAIGCKKTPCVPSRSALPLTREGYAGHP